MKIIDLAVVQSAEQPLVDDRLCHLKLVGEPALEADAAPHAIGLGGGQDGLNLLWGVRHRLLENDVFLRVRGGDGLLAVLARITSDVDHVQVGSGEHRVEVLIDLDRAAMPGGKFGRVERPR